MCYKEKKGSKVFDKEAYRTIALFCYSSVLTSMVL